MTHSFVLSLPRWQLLVGFQCWRTVLRIRNRSSFLQSLAHYLIDSSCRLRTSSDKLADSTDLKVLKESLLLLSKVDCWIHSRSHSLLPSFLHSRRNHRRPSWPQQMRMKLTM